MSAEQIAACARAEQKRMRRSALRVGAIVTFEIFAMALIGILVDDPLERIGAGLVALAMAFIGIQLWLHTRRTEAARRAIDWTARPSLEFVRGYIETRRRFHQGPWLWSRILVLLPGVPLLEYGIARRSPDAAIIAYVTAAAFVGLVGFAIRTQRRAARACTHQIEALRRAGADDAAPGA